MTDYDLGTRKRGDSLTFTVDLTITVDGTPVPDLTDWDPVCQFRKAPDVGTAFVPELLSVVGKVCTFGIGDALSASMSGAFKGEVQVTNPDAPAGYGTITWPGADGYLTLTMAADIVQVDP